MTDKASSMSASGNGGARAKPSSINTLRNWWNGLWGEHNSDTSVRDTLEELIEERVEAEVPMDHGELTLLSNILDLRDRTIDDVMVPRADIVAVDASTTLPELTDIMNRERHSRLPVYRETLDNALGMVHIKDVLNWRGGENGFSLRNIAHEVIFVSPSMQVLELLLEMRVKRCHMALVVDEFGGIDGLVTIEDLVEEIVGEIEDEHDVRNDPDFLQRSDGTIEAAARAPIEALEEVFGKVLDDAGREEIHTLGGLVFALAGHVPIRGEIITHPSGVEFEVLDADPRRIKRLRIRRRLAQAQTAANKSGE